MSPYKGFRGAGRGEFYRGQYANSSCLRPTSQLGHMEPAIDTQGLPGDVIGPVTNKICHGVRDIVGGSHGAQRHPLEHRLHLFLGQLLGHIGGDEAGRNSIYGNAARRDL